MTLNILFPIFHVDIYARTNIHLFWLPKSRSQTELLVIQLSGITYSLFEVNSINKLKSISSYLICMGGVELRQKNCQHES